MKSHRLGVNSNKTLIYQRTCIQNIQRTLKIQQEENK